MASTGSRLPAASWQDDQQLARCWQLQTCGSCLANHVAGRCGWCPYSMTCVPLPRTHLSPVFIPLSQNVCPVRTERFDLRTHCFGRISCQVSTLAFLALLLGIICTLIVLPLSWLAWKLLTALWNALACNYRGWEIVGDDVANGSVEREGLWFRQSTWSTFWHNQRRHHSLDDQPGKQHRFWFWKKENSSRKMDERRALLHE